MRNMWLEKMRENGIKNGKIWRISVSFFPPRGIITPHLLNLPVISYSETDDDEANVTMYVQ